MHPHSLATAVAISRLVEDPPVCIVEEVANFVELARMRLALSISSLAVALMCAQPLLHHPSWQPHWKFAYCVALSLGIKYTIDGFFVGDIIEFVTDEFSLEELKMGEMLAFCFLDGLILAQGVRRFRNALTNVALECYSTPDSFGLTGAELAAQSRTWMANGARSTHVLIVDGSAGVVRTVHEELMLAVCPDARVHATNTCDTRPCPAHLKHRVTS